MANITDKITDVRNAARPNSARVTSGRSAGGTTLACDNLSGWPTASKVHFVTYKIDSNSAVVAGTQLDCYGIVSGNNIGSFTVVDGSDTGHAVGDVVEMMPTAAWGQDLADALSVGHTRTGAHASSLPLTSPVITSGGSWAGSPTITSPTIADLTNMNHDHTSVAKGGGVGTTALINAYKFSVYRTSALTSSNTAAAVAHDTKLFDTGTNVDVATNKGRFTAPIAGFYYFNAVAGDSANITGAAFSYLYKNGVLQKQGTGINIGTNNIASTSVSGLLQLAANDYVEHYYVGGSGTAMGVGKEYCYFEGFLISAT